MIIHDQEGRIVKRTRWRKSKSFVKQFLQLLEYIINHAYDVNAVAGLSVTDTGNVARTLQATTSYERRVFAVLAPSGIVTYGMVVGTGTAAESVTDYALQTIIAHGTGSGQLSYGAQTLTTATVVGSSVNLVLTRAMVNGSGATITVQEIGVYFSNIDSGGAQRFFCGLRDLTGAVAVANGQTLTVQYTITTTV